MALGSDVETTQKELEACWTEKLASFEQRLAAATTSNNPTLQQLREDFLAFKDLVIGRINAIGDQMRNITKAIDVIDMRSRQKVLLFSGINESGDIEENVLRILHENMGLSHITGSSIKRCHPLGPKDNTSSRLTLVHFCDHRTKSDVWRSKAKLKGTSVSISEFLTRPRQLVHKKARRHFGMRNVWTLDGIINIKLPDGTRTKVCSEEELSPLIAKYPSIVASSTYDTSGGKAAPVDGNPLGVQMQDERRKKVHPGVQADDAKRSRRAGQKK